MQLKLLLMLNIILTLVFVKLNLLIVKPNTNITVVKEITADKLSSIQLIF